MLSSETPMSQSDTLAVAGGGLRRWFIRDLFEDLRLLAVIAETCTTTIVELVMTVSAGWV